MGYTILLQWSHASPNRQVPLNEYILTRILEHYNLSQHVRSTIQLRTFRASLPSSTVNSTSGNSTSSSNVTRLLTNIAYSHPIPPVRDVNVPLAPRDDTTYLVIEDRSVSAASSRSMGGMTGAAPTATDTGGHSSKPNSQAPTPIPPSAATPSNAAMEEDGFEIIDPPAAISTPTIGSATATANPAASESASPPKPPNRFQAIAVRPAAAVLPLLTNLLSPFVMGLTKSARAAASTTAETPRPTPLPGSTLVLTSLAFTTALPPHPPVVLTLHNLPTPMPASIFLEVEMEDESSYESTEQVQEALTAFLDGCLPEGTEGQRKFAVWEGEQTSWEGVERTRKTSQMLVRMLREGGFA